MGANHSAEQLRLAPESRHPLTERDHSATTGYAATEREAEGQGDHSQDALAEPLLDAVAAAGLLSVRPSWIYEAVRAGRLPHVKIGRHIRFLRGDLEAWILTRRVGARIAPHNRRQV